MKRLYCLVGIALVCGLLLAALVLTPTDPLSAANRRLLKIHEVAQKRGDLDEREVMALSHYLTSTQAVIREFAASVSADARSEGTRQVLEPLLVGALHDTDPNVRKEAITTLDSFGTTNVLPLLRRFLNDPDPAVASEAKLALEAFGQRTAGVGVALTRQGSDLVVAGIFPDSPAGLDKRIHLGDRVIAIAQSNQPPANVSGFSTEQTVRLLRGPRGSTVTVQVIARDGSDPRIITFVRDEFAK